MIRCLSIELTSQCNIRCAHCAPMCTSKTRGSIASDLLTEAIATCGEMRIPRVSATGGEPFLHPDLLHQFVTESVKADVRWRIVSNGFWAKSPVLRRLLKDFAACGRGGLSISVDRYHQAHIPLATIQESILYAKGIGIPVEINFVIDRHPDTLSILREIATWDVPLAIASLVSLGRAADLSGHAFFEQVSLDGCDTAENPYLRIDGTLTVCCGATQELLSPSSALVLGNARESPLRKLLASHGDRYTACLKKIGPYRLSLEVASEPIGCGDEGAGQFTGLNYCEICAKLACLPEAVERIRNGSLGHDSGSKPAGFDCVIPEEGFELKPTAELICFPYVNAGIISNREHLPTAGVIAFFDHVQHRQDYCLVDTPTCHFVSCLIEDGWESARELFGLGRIPTLPEVSLRLSVSRLWKMGILDARPYSKVATENIYGETGVVS